MLNWPSITIYGCQFEHLGLCEVCGVELCLLLGDGISKRLVFFRPLFDREVPIRELVGKRCQNGLQGSQGLCLNERW